MHTSTYKYFWAAADCSGPYCAKPSVYLTTLMESSKSISRLAISPTNCRSCLIAAAAAHMVQKMPVVMHGSTWSWHRHDDHRKIRARLAPTLALNYGGWIISEAIILSRHACADNTCCMQRTARAASSICRENGILGHSL